MLTASRRNRTYSLRNTCIVHGPILRYAFHYGQDISRFSLNSVQLWHPRPNQREEACWGSRKWIWIHFLFFYCSRYRPGVVQRVGRGIALLLHDRGTRRGEWSAARPGRTLPPGNTGYSFYRRLGGPQGRSGRAENLFPTGIRSRTIQPVISRYTDWATWPNNECELLFENNHIISFTSAY